MKLKNQFFIINMKQNFFVVVISAYKALPQIWLIIIYGIFSTHNTWIRCANKSAIIAVTQWYSAGFISLSILYVCGWVDFFSMSCVFRDRHLPPSIFERYVWCFVLCNANLHFPVAFWRCIYILNEKKLLSPWKGFLKSIWHLLILWILNLCFGKLILFFFCFFFFFF